MIKLKQLIKERKAMNHNPASTAIKLDNSKDFKEFMRREYNVDLDNRGEHNEAPMKFVSRDFRSGDFWQNFALYLFKNKKIK